MKKIILHLFFIAFAISLHAQNPICPPGSYIPDPSAKVFNDRLYIYGSWDDNINTFCSKKYYVMSTDDLKTWTIHDLAFTSEGKNDQVPYNDLYLFAPDCVYKDGKYYLYYSQPGPDAEGVAVSDKPEGPFINGQKIELYGYNQIDPAVFIDDDGTAYYTWGQFSAKLAKLKPNMTEIDESTIKDGIITEDEHFFHEGNFMTKRNGIYYMIYAHMGRRNTPTGIGYATSDKPYGPYKYGGIIVDNGGCDPTVWNNHGSIVEFKGNWYVLYHRNIGGYRTQRRACIEPITFNDDGSIDEVEMTSQGVNGPLNAFEEIDAGWACMLQGEMIIKETNKNDVLAKVSVGSKAGFKYIDFGEGIDSIHVKVKKGKTVGGFNVKIDQPWGKTLGYVHIDKYESGDEWQLVSFPMNQVSGVHAVWFDFYLLKGATELDIEIDWFRFE